MRSSLRRLLTASSLVAAVVAAPLTVGTAGAASAADAPAPAPAVEKAVGDDAFVERGQALTRLAAQTGDDFYTAPATLPARDGDVITSEPSVMYLDPIKLIKLPAAATRIMYKTTGDHGTPTAVTGTILLPTTPWKGRGKRPVIAWGPGTQGMGDRCAPSRTLSTGLQYEAILIQSLVTAGYAVAVTDYQGLGLPGEHTYAIREPQGHAMLDIARAAGRMGIAGIDATNPIGLAGYSEGGGAAGAAAELASTYAPELPVKGTFVGAAPADLGRVADTIDSGIFSVFSLYAVTSVGATAGVDPATILNAKGRAAIAKANQSCVADGLVGYAFTDSSTWTTSGKKLKDVLREEPWASAAAQQRLGMAGRTPNAPVVVADSLTDDVTPNLPEAAVLLDAEPATDLAGMRAQASALRERGVARVLIKGGHLIDGPEAIDLWLDEAGELALRAPLIDTTNTHGTGCTLSSAIAALYARSGDWRAAVTEAKAWLSAAIVRGASLEVGRGHGPVHHFHESPRWA